MPGLNFKTSDNRLAFYPINEEYRSFYDLYCTSTRSFWTVDEIDSSDDRTHYYKKLSADERRMVDHILAFFASSDKLVNINISSNFLREIPIPEVQYFYNFQASMEDIHGETYSRLLETIIEDTSTRANLFNAINSMDIIGEMSEWIRDWFDDEKPLEERLIGMACTEGIFFSGCFCCIYWLASRGLMPGLSQSNELIARDEGLHTIFAIKLFLKLLAENGAPLSQYLPMVHRILMSAVELAIKFANCAIPTALVQINAALMSKYIKSVADNFLTMLGADVIYGESDPFAFTKMLNINNKTNFFEKRVTEYVKYTSQNAQDPEENIEDVEF